MLDLLLDHLLELAWAHPVWTFMAVLGFVRLWGTVIQTGWAGVLFVFGRTRRTLEPGFHFLLPLVHFVRKTPVRSITLYLPSQRATTADGLVYDVEANLVYRVVDPILALTHVDNLRKAAPVVLAMTVQQVVSRHTRQSLQNRSSLDQVLTTAAQEGLGPWGVTVEQAGFTTIAPTRKTLRLTQLWQLVQERERMLNLYVQQGLSRQTALGLLGSHRSLVGHAQAHYRRRQARRAMHRVALVQTVPLLIALSTAQPRADTSDTVFYESVTERASRGRAVKLQVGEKVRLHMAARRSIDKVVVQKNACIEVRTVRQDGRLIELTALKAGESVILVSNKRTGGETFRVTVTDAGE